MRIMLSNDDGFESPGILELYKRLHKERHEVAVVAPSRERSTAGHSLTLHKPLRIHEVAPHIYSVSGSPADSVYMGTRLILKTKPDLVISGINRGANVGHDIFYSGTVAAAREAYIFGIPALAISLCQGFPMRSNEKCHWESAINFVSIFVKNMKKEFKGRWLINVNVPNLPPKKIKGVQWTRQGERFYTNETIENRDPRGKPYYWIGGGPVSYDKTPGTDCVAVGEGYISITPLKLDTTDDALKARLEVKTKNLWK